MPSTYFTDLWVAHCGKQEDAPGNIGSFSGWQIVKTFMKKNPKNTIEKLMSIDAREIYSEAKYKPKA